MKFNAIVAIAAALCLAPNAVAQETSGVSHSQHFSGSDLTQLLFLV